MRLHQDHGLVAKGFQRGDRLGRGNRHRYDAAPGSRSLQRLQGHPHRSPGGDAVIHQDDAAVADDGQGVAWCVDGAPAGDFGELPSEDAADLRVGHAEFVPDILVDHTPWRIAVGNGAQCQLRKSRRRELPDHEQVQRCAQCLRHFIAHRYPAARQGEHEWLWQVQRM